MPNTKKAASPTQEEQPMQGQLENFFLNAVKETYQAEKSLLQALPRLEEGCTTSELQKALNEHLAQTEEHVNRLEEVFGLLNQQPEEKTCEAMQGLIRESEKVLEETQEGTATRDVAIIMAAQKVEHYEMATYGSLAQLATTMELPEIAGILNQTLDEEKQTDALLTEIAENDINWESYQEDEGETDDDEDMDEEEETETDETDKNA